MDYGQVLSRAWHTIWRHKILWIFGILAGCGSSGASSGSNSISYTFEGQLPTEIQNIVDQLSPDQWTLLIVLFLIALLLMIILVIFFSTIGRTGLILGAQRAESNPERISLGTLFSDSLPYFWRVFGLSLLVGLAVFFVVLGLVLLAAFSVAVTLGIALLCWIPLICLLVPVFWFIAIILEQSAIAIVIENQGVFAGLRRGWEVSSQNLGTMIVMGLILMVGFAGIVGFILFSPLFLITAPVIAGLMSGQPDALQAGLVIFGLCLVAYLPILILLNGILQSFITTAWTLTYLRLTASRSIEPVTADPLPAPG